MNYIPKTDKEKALAKWISILYGGYDRGADDCSFCHRYYENYCKGCPLDTCGHGSPYDKWADTCDSNDDYVIERTGNIRVRNYRNKKSVRYNNTVRTQEQFDTAMAMIAAIKAIKE